MGLVDWKLAPDGKILDTDVTETGNYLSDREKGMINRIVSSFLDFAELKAEKHIPLTMEDWEREFDKVIDLMDFRHLREHGQPRMEEAEQLYRMRIAA